MTKGRDNAAESLGDVLELVRQRKQNGSLSVERFYGGRFEEGEIFFQEGLPVHAQTGALTGQEALNWLISWRQIYFTFLHDEARTTAAAKIPATSPISVRAPIPVTPTTPVTAFPNRVASRNFPTNPNAQRFQTPAGNNYQSGNENTNTRSGFNSSGNQAAIEQLIPRKLDSAREVLSLPLTRPQRSIYLLIDGQRTLSDISRCTRKSLQEIERLVSELQEHGLITF